MPLDKNQNKALLMMGSVKNIANNAPAVTSMIQSGEVTARPDLKDNLERAIVAMQNMRAAVEARNNG